MGARKSLFGGDEFGFGFGNLTRTLAFHARRKEKGERLSDFNLISDIDENIFE